MPSNITREKHSLVTRLKNTKNKFIKKREKEYSKRMLTKIVNNSLLMMWASYILAYIGRVDIAETLSKTIASSVIAIAIGYFAKSAVENISKNTTAFGENINHTDSEKLNIDC